VGVVDGERGKVCEPRGFGGIRRVQR
jgi:hypothetical protein